MLKTPLLADVPSGGRDIHMQLSQGHASHSAKTTYFALPYLWNRGSKHSLFQLGNKYTKYFLLIYF